MSLIISINAREILDSRGNPTLEVDVLCDDGTLGRAAVPSGASTGKHEVLELRDADKRRYLGNGVLKAVKNINNIISRSIVGMDVTSQSGIDNMMLDMDGTKNKSKLGANAILGVSLSIAVAAANSLGIPLYRYIGGAFANTLPVPLMNIINGGAHADNNLDFQEFMIVPFGFDSFRDSIRAGVETFHNLKSLLKSKGYSTTVGDEGGFAPNLKSNEEALELISKAIEKSGYKIGKNISLALDVASSEFFNKGKYKLQGNNMSTDKLISIYQEYINKYHIVSIEDPLSEDDWNGWKNITDALGNKVQIVGDDLFVTNTQRLKRGIDGGIANSILIKVNQIGTLTETIEAIEMAKMAGYTYIISHRSGETEDSFISDLAVATNSGQIKTGSASRSDRLAKYNQLLRIEEELGKSSIFKGKGLYKIN